MTTKEIDHLFTSLHGVEQFVCGNIALDRHRKFFLNLPDAEKLAILKERGHLDGSLIDQPKNIPVMIDLLQCVRRARKAGFGEGHPIRQSLRELIRIEQPILAASIAKSKAERDARNRKPTQMRLW